MAGLKIALAAAAIVAASPVFAADYCWTSKPRICMGCEQTAYMKVVVSSVPRPKFTTEGGGVWCGLSFRSLSAFYKPLAVTERPKSGVVGVHKYEFGYKSDKVGQDEFTIQTSQLNGLNGKQTGVTLHVKVDVVAAAF